MRKTNSIESCKTAHLQKGVCSLLLQSGFKWEELLSNDDPLKTCSVQLKDLNQYGHIATHFLDSGTSGDSSACYSENEENKRSSKPTLREAARVLIEENSFVLDSNLDKIKHSKSSKIRLLLTRVSDSFTKNDFKTQLERITYRHHDYSYYFTLTSVDFVFYHTEWSLKLSLETKRDSATEFLRYAFEEPRMVRLLGKHFKLNWVKEYRYNQDSWFTVIFRNIPYFVAKENIDDLCKKENVTILYSGPKTKIKDTDCCLVRFSSIEEAEAVCKRLSNLPLRCGNEKYYLKVNINPYTKCKHKENTRSMFAGLLKNKVFADDLQPQRIKSSAEELNTITTDTQRNEEKMAIESGKTIQRQVKETLHVEDEGKIISEILEVNKSEKKSSKKGKKPEREITKKSEKNQHALSELLGSTVQNPSKANKIVELPTVSSGLSTLVNREVNKEGTMQIEVAEVADQKEKAIKSDLKSNQSNNDIANLSTQESRKRDISPDKKTENDQNYADHQKGIEEENIQERISPPLKKSREASREKKNPREESSRAERYEKYEKKPESKKENKKESKIDERSEKNRKSRSRERSKRRHESKDRETDKHRPGDRDREHGRSKRRSASRERDRPNHRGRSRDRSRSKDRKRPNERDRSREREQMKERNRSRERGRSREKERGHESQRGRYSRERANKSNDKETSASTRERYNHSKDDKDKRHQNNSSHHNGDSKNSRHYYSQHRDDSVEKSRSNRDRSKDNHRDKKDNKHEKTRSPKRRSNEKKQEKSKIAKNQQAIIPK